MQRFVQQWQENTPPTTESFAIVTLSMFVNAKIPSRSRFRLPAPVTQLVRSFPSLFSYRSHQAWSNFHRRHQTERSSSSKRRFPLRKVWAATACRWWVCSTPDPLAHLPQQSSSSALPPLLLPPPSMTTSYELPWCATSSPNSSNKTHPQLWTELTEF
jgi:hypothetical protein